MTEMTAQPALRVLWLEDTSNDQELGARALAREGLVCNFTFAQNQGGFEAALQQGRFDLVLADYTLPGYDGSAALAAVQRWQPEVPLIYVSGQVDEERVVRSLKAGAADYVSKDRLQRLGPAVERALREAAERRGRRQAEEHLRQAQKLHETLINHIPFGVDIVDEAGRVLFMNQVLAKLGRSGPGRHCWEIYKDDPQRCLDCVMRQPLAPSQMEQREQYFMLGGRTYQINYVGVEYGGKPAALRLFQDITERKQAEEAHARLAAIVTSANDGIIAKTLEGMVTSWNKSAERIYGYTAEEMVGQSIALLVPPERRGELALFHERIRRGEPIVNFETRRLRKNGQQFDVSLTASPIRDGGGKVVGISMIIRDITERKQLESQLRQAQKMEAVGQLAGGVAHDFNNMLFVLQAHADLTLMDSERLPAAAIENLKQMAAVIQRAAGLSRQLLAFGRKQVMQPQAVNLNEVIEQLVKMLGRLIGEHITLECDYAPAQQMVEADIGMLEQVILNLAVNARDAMPKGGLLVLRTDTVELEEGRLQAHPEVRAGRFVRLRVEDSGCGIAPEHLTRIFEPFFTTKEAGKGTGLGLSVVYGIVKQHRGWIEVTSEVGRGTTFTIYLPALAAGLNQGRSEQAVREAPRGTEGILVVEDEPAVQFMAKQLLEKGGYRVWLAGSGHEAEEVWKQQGARIDLLLTDVVMPGGVSGFELAAKLQGQKATLKVLVMSGYPGEMGAQEARALEDSGGLLRKPFSGPDLLQAIRHCLDRN